eukprot:jgi/Chlat1/3128/Chrsp21S03360
MVLSMKVLDTETFYGWEPMPKGGWQRTNWPLIEWAKDAPWKLGGIADDKRHASHRVDRNLERIRKRAKQEHMHKQRQLKDPDSAKKVQGRKTKIMQLSLIKEPSWERELVAAPAVDAVALQETAVATRNKQQLQVVIVPTPADNALPPTEQLKETAVEKAPTIEEPRGLRRSARVAKKQNAALVTPMDRAIDVDSQLATSPTPSSPAMPRDQALEVPTQIVRRLFPEASKSQSLEKCAEDDTLPRPSESRSHSEVSEPLLASELYDSDASKENREYETIASSSRASEKGALLCASNTPSSVNLKALARQRRISAALTTAQASIVRKRTTPVTTPERRVLRPRRA